MAQPDARPVFRVKEVSHKDPARGLGKRDQDRLDVLALRALKGAAADSRPVRCNPGQAHQTSAFGAQRLGHLRRIGFHALNVCHSTSPSFGREHYRSPVT